MHFNFVKKEEKVFFLFLLVFILLFTHYVRSSSIYGDTNTFVIGLLNGKNLIDRHLTAVVEITFPIFVLSSTDGVSS